MSVCLFVQSVVFIVPWPLQKSVRFARFVNWSSVSSSVAKQSFASVKSKLVPILLVKICNVSKNVRYKARSVILKQKTTMVGHFSCN